MQRREFMNGVAAIAATRWDNEEYDIENAENWDTMEGGSYTTGKFDPSAMRASGEGSVASWSIDPSEFDERVVEVYYDTSGVHVSMEGNSDGLYGGALGQFDPEEAKQLAAAIYQAAEMYDRHPRGDDR
jgi:hypothetical protein